MRMQAEKREGERTCGKGTEQSLTASSALLPHTSPKTLLTLF